MSRPGLRLSSTNERFPRVSGDEPQLSATPTVKGEFSPRERG